MKFEESNAKMRFDKSFFKPILSFSGWSVLGSATFTLFSQVSNVIISAFFNPAVVAGRAIASQVRNTSAQFVTNFRTAANPQIIKRYSEGNIEGYKKLLFQSTDISFYLMLIIIVPIIFEAGPILKLWLKTVPDYTILFVKIALIEALFAVYDSSYYMIFQATGRLKENAIICPILDIIVFIFIVIYYYMGGSPIAIAWGLLLLTVLQGMFVKPYLAIKFFGFKWSDFTPFFLKNGVVTVLSCVLPVFLLLTLNDTIVNSVVIFVSAFLSTGLFITFVGLNKEQRTYIAQLVRVKIRRK
jgi:O-antigen/teichoic acid export membrane protein